MSEQPTDLSNPTDATENAAPSTPMKQFECERLTRRAALRKFGFGAGIAALIAFSGDDLARLAATKLKQNAGDNKLANQVADEFRNAGVAFAGPSCGGCTTCTPTYYTSCTSCSFWCGFSKAKRGVNHLPDGCQGANASNCEACQTSYLDACLAKCAADGGGAIALQACIAGCSNQATLCELVCTPDDEGNGERISKCWAKSGKV